MSYEVYDDGGDLTVHHFCGPTGGDRHRYQFGTIGQTAVLTTEEVLGLIEALASALCRHAYAARRAAVDDAARES